MSHIGIGESLAIANHRRGNLLAADIRRPTANQAGRTHLSSPEENTVAKVVLALDPAAGYPGGPTLPFLSSIDFTPGELLGSVSGALGFRRFLEGLVVDGGCLAGAGSGASTGGGGQ